MAIYTRRDESSRGVRIKKIQTFPHTTGAYPQPLILQANG